MKTTFIDAGILASSVSSERISKQETDKQGDFGSIINSLSTVNEKDSSKTLEKQVPTDSLKSNKTFDEVKKDDVAKSGNVDSKKESVKDANSANSVKDNNPLKEKLEVDDKLEDTSEKIKQTLIEMLHISEDELEAAMQVLGITYLDCLDKVNLAELLTQVNGGNDTSVLITDESMYQQFNELSAVVDGLKEDLLSQLGLTEEEFNVMVEEMNNLRFSVSSELNGMVAGNETAIESVMTESNPSQIAQANENQLADSLDTTDTKISQDETSVTTSTSSLAGAEKEYSATQLQKENNQDLSKDNDSSLLSDTKDDKFDVDNSVYQKVVNQQDMVNQTEEVVPNETSVIDTESLLKQIEYQVKILTTMETSSMEFQLNPEHLGNLTIQIVSKDGLITASFRAQNEAIKEVIESQIVQLKENMNNQGLKVEAVEVTVESHQFERNLEQGNSNTNQEQYEQQQKKTRRQFNLNDSESLEDLTAEESVIAEMMIGNGNTLNYTV